MKKMTYLVLAMLVCGWAYSQEKTTYTFKYGNGRPGVTVVDTALRAVAPDTSKTFLLITGLTFTECDKKGQPQKNFRETLASIDDAISRQIQLLGNSLKAAHFTYNCSRLGYYYLRDTADMRTVLETFYRQNFPEYPYQIQMRPDPQWEVYLKHLVPDKSRGAVLPPTQ